MAVVKENIVAGIKISAIIYVAIVIYIVMSTKKVTLQIMSSTLPAIALLADGVNYLISAAALELERDGINIKCQNDDCSKGRIIIRVKNNSKNVAKNVNALISTEKGYPGIEDELLLWLPSSESERPDTEVSIKPKHSRKLLIFEYERAQRAPGGYVIKVLSKGSVDKPRARLRLDFYTNFYTKYVFRIKVDGERVRSPLDIKLYITMNKLDAITSSKTMFKKAYINENVPNVARKVFNIVLRELGNDRGIAERAATLRRRILISKSSNIKGYLRIANGFETLYNELMNQFRLLAEYLGLVFGVSYEYAVYLALAKRWDELTPLIKSIRSRLLSLSRNDDVYIMTELLLNLIITDEEFRKKFSDWLTSGNIYDTLKYYVPNHLRPALALLLNYGQITCKSACGINEEEKCSNQCCKNCKRILNALNGNENMVKEIASDLDSVLRRHWVYEDWVGGSSEKSAPPALIKEIIDYVRNNEKPQDWGFFSRAVVELRLPTTSRLRFILILHDLLRAREEFEKGNIDEAIKFVDLAEAHAIIGTAKFDPLSFTSHFFNLFELFASDLKSKLKGSRRFEISDVDVLELLRLYHYHVETNIAETWP
ncbi:hypothetical protein B7L70_03330 [Vulcanisaeta sp. EB80]|uniref:hypothetical protein n=1 Tax=Vulcanisaeta sp. EB80 TaxID=1650660 RepID=UPI0009BE2A96|nr:hypothetical protein [Vulcanisaeta sp. EB80]PLC68492.1 hypothetical protein B7L70_03330 [Vulcanisaeta sp. EB80]